MSDGPAAPRDTLVGAHVLVVDDDEIFVAAIGRLLEVAGYHVTTASDFQRALAALEADRRIDVLVTDIVMPAGVNGIALSRMARLRQRDLRVIYITGYHMPEAVHEALGPVLRKPVDEEELLRQVALALANPPCA